MGRDEIMTALKYTLRFLPDEQYIKLYYWLRLKRKVNLQNPQTLNEKIQWMKFNCRHPLMSAVSDKHLVRDYVKDRIGEEYLIPLLGVWETFDDIDFSLLPEQFVLKCNHDSGGLVICKDKKNLDLAKTRKKLEKSLKRKFYLIGREFQYRAIRPKIIAEQFIGDTASSPLDYKFYCYHGKADAIMLCKNRFANNTHRAEYVFYDTQWNFLPCMLGDDQRTELPDDPKPENLEQMVVLAETLSQDFLFARVDLYNIDGEIYFGEITLSPNSGFDPDLSYESDLAFGQKLQIPYLNDLTWR